MFYNQVEANFARDSRGFRLATLKIQISVILRTRFQLAYWLISSEGCRFRCRNKPKSALFQNVLSVLANKETNI